MVIIIAIKAAIMIKITDFRFLKRKMNSFFWRR
jgi:hypothetical protein